MAKDVSLLILDEPTAALTSTEAPAPSPMTLRVLITSAAMASAEPTPLPTASTYCCTAVPPRPPWDLGQVIPAHPPMATDEVRYVGEAVACVVARERRGEEVPCGCPCP